ncbi:MAG: ABC transporter substrate-binding protein [Candidatus Acidiferrales bacterium]
MAALFAATALAAPLRQDDASGPHRTVKDETGRQVELPATIRRVVSLAPNLTEIMFALGAEDRLVGVTSYSDFPPEAQKIKGVGLPLGPSLEAIVALKPDLVIATPTANRIDTVHALEKLGIPVYGTDPHTVEDTIHSIVHVAEVLGVESKGQHLAGQLQARLDALHARLANEPPRRVLFVVWEEPLISIGQHTFITDALRWAGAESVVNAKQDWPVLSLEEVVRLKPDALVFAASHGESSAEEIAGLRERLQWREIPAVREGRAAAVSDAIERPAPRLVDAIEELAHQLHPAAFADEKAGPK